MPKLSIITINLNNKKGLDKTIRSVIAQTYTDFEYIVIDGGSKDGSVGLIKQHGGKITRWISEEDTGIYNAMNKGIRYATGIYCLFLNSGDYLCSENTLTEIFKMDPAEDIVYGNMFIQIPGGEKMHGEMPDNITLEHMIKDTLWHPVSLIKRALFDKYGFYREDLKIVSDYDFFFKNIIVNKVSIRHIPVSVAVFDLQGISSTSENNALVKAERRKVQMQYVDEKVIDSIQQETTALPPPPTDSNWPQKVIKWFKKRV